jgi:hypothetical protein
VDAGHRISASFGINTYSIASSSSLHGSISPSGNISVAHGGSQSFTLMPDEGYQIGQLIVDGVSVAASGLYNFTNVQSNHSIAVNFVPKTYTITASAGEHGSISPDSTVSVEHGSSQTYTISVDPECTISDVLVDGTSVGAVTSYTFTNVTANHAISAFFSLQNQAPIADAGPDQTVESGTVVNLKGSNSIDLDDGIASFEWEQISGPVVEFTSDPVGFADVSFISPDVGPEGVALVFELTVTDCEGLQSVDTCIVNVSWVNIAPVSDAGADQIADEGTTVILDGSKSEDTDGDDIVSYLWEQTEGVTVTLSDATAVQPAFLAPDVSTAGMSLSFQLTVTDGGGLQSVDTCIVNVSWVNIAPVSDAGADQTADEGTLVTLNGTNSSDADDGIALYLWKQVSGIPVTLSDTTSIQPEFTAPRGITQTESLTFSLTVQDAGGLESSDSCEISVSPVIPIPSSVLNISSISIELVKIGKNYKAIAYATIIDETGKAVTDASVTGNWALNGKPLSSTSDLTNSMGETSLVSKPFKARTGDVLLMSIADVAKEGFVYEPVSHSVSIVVP